MAEGIPRKPDLGVLSLVEHDTPNRVLYLWASMFNGAQIHAMSLPRLEPTPFPEPQT